MPGASGDDDAPADDERDVDADADSAGPNGRGAASEGEEAARGDRTGGEVPRGDQTDEEVPRGELTREETTTGDRAGEDAPSGVIAGENAAPIDPEALTVDERSLHPRIRILWVVRATIWALVLGAIATALTWAYLEVTLLAPLALTAVLLVLFVTHAVLRYRVWQYEFREDAIYLERGVLRRVRTVVPFVRIQHVDTARGPIDRVAGLSTLVVYTAGSRGADVTIPGIEADRASDHQRRLKQLAIAAEDDTAV